MASISTTATTAANAFAVGFNVVAAAMLSEAPWYALTIQSCDTNAPTAWRGITVLRTALYAPTARTDVTTVTPTVDVIVVTAVEAVVTAGVDVVVIVAAVVGVALDASEAVATIGAEKSPSHVRHATPQRIAQKSPSRRLRW